ncbi:MAG: HNH endonuclease, partial [Lachnospiraceae bacterium]|nr:HNH endonuclease [Lachnospiraceae bacterium]
HPFSQKQTMPHPAHPAISVSLAEWGANDESNLMSLCRSCHEKIHRERGDR